LNLQEYFFLSFARRKLLNYKEELLTDTKNLLYRCPDDMELLDKQFKDADQKLVQCMQQIKSMAEEKELRRKQLDNLQEAAQVGAVDNRTLLEHLREAL
jgi:hypothetical protein